jgi:integrase
VLLRLELTPAERVRFFQTFDDEQAFRDHIGAHRRRNGRLAASAATSAYFARYRELRDFFIVAVETGLRNRSDLRNLRWREVDLEGGFIRLTMQKTGFEATIPISRACGAVLARLHARRGAGENVFIDAGGRRLSPSRIKRAFKLAKALAGITRRLRVHDLRHTFGCRLASGGVPLQMIAKALGHTTTKMAERYARPSEESMRLIVGALDRDQ